VLIGGQNYKEFFIKRDKKELAYIELRLDMFWKDYVKKDVMPAVVGSHSEQQTLLGMFPNSDGEFGIGTDADNATIETLVELKAQMNETKSLITKLENELRKRIGSDGKKGIETELYRVTWIRSDSRQFDMKAFKDSNYSMYERYSRPTKRDMGIRIKEINR